MSEETINDNGNQLSDETLNTEPKPVKYERFKQVNEEKLAALAELEKLKASQREKEEKALAEQGKYKELYEQGLAELEPLRAAKAELEQRKQELNERNKERLALIPEDKRAFIPEIDDPVKLERWLDRSLPLIVEQQKPQAPKGDGGAKSTVNPTHTKLTAEEEVFARMAGMSPERYAAQKAKRGEPIDIEKLGKKE